MNVINTLSNLAKDNPLTALGGLLAGVIVGAIALDERYAHAGDLDRVNQSISVSSLRSEVSILELRRAGLADKVYELDVRKPTPESQALRVRYQADLQQLTTELQEKKKRITQLETGGR